MSLDTSILLALNSLVGRSPALDAFLLFCADYLAYVALVLLAVIVWKRAGSLRDKIELLTLSVGAGIISRYGVAELIRHFYHRPRPFLALPGDVHSLFTDPSWSFPSGHASFFFALSTVVFLYDRRLGYVFFALSAVITIGRVAAGVHYPSDILAGAVLGSLVGYLLYRFARPALSKIVNSTY